MCLCVIFGDLLFIIYFFRIAMESSHFGHERLRQVERWRYRTIPTLAKTTGQPATESNQENANSFRIQKIHYEANIKPPLG